MEYRFLTAGERCVTVSFGNEVSIEMNTRVRMLRNELEKNPIEGVVETVPTYCALSVHYLPNIIRRCELEKRLEQSITDMKPVSDSENRVKEVPVLYGGETGPDLEYCARLENISTDELIRRHTEHEYYVYQLGFSPGHPYMARKEEPFSFRRRETPRVNIPAHSVVAQTNLTNITPFHQPSGWNILGSTPLNITDYSRENPFFFKAGDHVKLRAIDKAEYDRIKMSQEKESSDETEIHRDPSVRGGFTIDRAGALTTIQDEGRFGYQAGGVSPAGPMDSRSFHIANIFAGNRMGAPALEITFIGPAIRFNEDSLIAVTGADLTPKINGAVISMYKPVTVSSGDVLSFGARQNGLRAYVAFAGGIDEKIIMGSCATDIKNSLGGHEGRALKQGDVIRIGRREHNDATGTDGCENASVPEWNEEICGAYFDAVTQEIFDDKDITVRVVLGPQDDRFTKAGIRRFLNHSAIVTDKSDRQGIRLECEPLEFVTDCNIISDGISLGAVQVAGDGKPIILLADRQSVGGYAKIANVIYTDLPKLAQAVPGCRVRFVEVSVELAEELYIREIGALKKLEEIYVQN